MDAPGRRQAIGIWVELAGTSVLAQAVEGRAPVRISVQARLGGVARNPSGRHGHGFDALLARREGESLLACSAVCETMDYVDTTDITTRVTVLGVRSVGLEP
jgi:hypothetical protein